MQLRKTVIRSGQYLEIIKVHVPQNTNLLPKRQILLKFKLQDLHFYNEGKIITLSLYKYKKSTTYGKISIKNNIHLNDIKINVWRSPSLGYSGILLAHTNSNLYTYKRVFFRSNSNYKPNNIKSAKTRFRRLVETNYIKGISKTLVINTPCTYIDDGNRYYKNFMRKLKRYLNKQYNFIELKYISVPEFNNKGHIHYHIILFNMPYISFDILLKLNDGLNTHIQTVYYLPGLIIYISKQFTPSNPFGKMYSSSRNLDKPLKIVGNTEININQYTLLYKSSYFDYFGNSSSYQKFKIT